MQSIKSYFYLIRFARDSFGTDSFWIANLFCNIAGKIMGFIRDNGSSSIFEKPVIIKDHFCAHWIYNFQNSYLEPYRSYPLAAVTELTMGRWASTLVSLLLDLSVFGGGIPNLLVGKNISNAIAIKFNTIVLNHVFACSASQNLQLFGLRLSREEFNLSFCYWLLIVGMILCPILWLRTPHQMKWVKVKSLT